MSNQQSTRYKLGKILLIPTTIIICLVVIEIGYRTLDPFPYIHPRLVNLTEHGNLSQHDSVLGWKGVPNGKTRFTTKNNSVLLQHNSKGFRDIEHKSNADKPAIVFLGDSFTWGFEVEFEDMFVNQLRKLMPEYEIFNLSHRGYGTDQEYLLFNNWDYDGEIKVVVLMFSENDITDNNSYRRYSKSKPQYLLENSELILTGVPVPLSDKWKKEDKYDSKPTEIGGLKTLMLKSHLIHELYYQYRIIKRKLRKGNTKLLEQPDEDPLITFHLLSKLMGSVEQKGAQLVIAFIPSKLEIEGIGSYRPYQTKLLEFCNENNLNCINLAPAFFDSWSRTYYIQGAHWTPHGNKVATEAIYNYLIDNSRLFLDNNSEE